VFVWYQHLNIPPSSYCVLFKHVRDFSVYSQKTLNQWESSWHGEVILRLWDGALHSLEGPRCCSFWVPWKVSANLWQVDIYSKSLDQGHYQNLVLSSIDSGEHLVLGRFVLPSINTNVDTRLNSTYQTNTSTHFLLVKINSDLMWRFLGSKNTKP
jgi:hypothetical protein